MGRKKLVKKGFEGKNFSENKEERERRIMVQKEIWTDRSNI